MTAVSYRTIATPVTIANNQTVSGPADLGGLYLTGLLTPAALTGTVLTFQASLDGATWVPVHTPAGAAYSVTVGASRYIPIPVADFVGVRHLKVVSGTTELGDRVITLVASAAGGDQ